MKLGADGGFGSLCVFGVRAMAVRLDLTMVYGFSLGSRYAILSRNCYDLVDSHIRTLKIKYCNALRGPPFQNIQIPHRD